MASIFTNQDQFLDNWHHWGLLLEFSRHQWNSFEDKHSFQMLTLFHFVIKTLILKKLDHFE
jgi:hypothetical protein